MRNALAWHLNEIFWKINPKRRPVISFQFRPVYFETVERDYSLWIATIWVIWLAIFPLLALKHVSCSTNMNSASEDKRAQELLWDCSLCWAPDACRENTLVPAKSNSQKTPPTRALHSIRKYCGEERRRVQEGERGPLDVWNVNEVKFYIFAINYSRQCHFCAVVWGEMSHLCRREKPNFNHLPALRPRDVQGVCLTLISHCFILEILFGVLWWLAFQRCRFLYRGNFYFFWGGGMPRLHGGSFHAFHVFVRLTHTAAHCFWSH